MRQQGSRDPYQLLTRAQFLIELLETLEYTEKYAKKMGQDVVAYEYYAAQRAIKTMYRAEELIDLDWLELISRDEDTDNGFRGDVREGIAARARRPRA